MPGAYVHVPFCAHRCAYCSFIAQEGKREEGDFFESVETEIRSRRDEAAAEPFDTVYFGGGTPSYVDALRLGGVLGTLEEIFGFSSNIEITAEANPDDLGSEKLSALLALGVNRLSIGVQSLVDSELMPLERRHDAAAARQAVTEAVRAFGNVSADLRIANEFDSQRTNKIDLCSDQISWQSIFGNPHSQHSRWNRLHFIDRGSKAQQRQIVSRSQPGRPGPDDGNLFAVSIRGQFLIGEELPEAE